MNQDVFDPRVFTTTLPPLPGVYRMLGEGDAVLYVGKARDLKKRVSSYFQKQDALSPRIAMMVSRIQRVEITVTRTEAEALVLENTLIKTLAPRYNILFRDDKSYPYLMFTAHAYPRVAYYRGATDRQQRFFGPYPNAWAVKETINLLQKVFQLRNCEDSVFANRSRPCLLHQIHRCTAPCTGLISATDYAADVTRAVSLLEGRTDDVMAELGERMQQAAAALEFEQAAALRDRLHSLATVQARQFMEGSQGQDVDIVVVREENAHWCVGLAMVRGGRHLGDRHFFPGNTEAADAAEVLDAFLQQHYAEQKPPDTLILGTAPHSESRANWLSELAGRRVNLVLQPGGERRAWLEMAQVSARVALTQHLAQRNAQGHRLEALQAALDNPGLDRIECFDISHTQGEATVASCVVYAQGELQRAEYRRYNINGITPGDDYAAMRQVLTRRYARTARGEGKRPDLILVDGGAGQLAQAREVLAELGLSMTLLAGIVKGEGRKAEFDRLLRADGSSVPLAAEHPALHLIQSLRDEAHRFAISGHRAARGRARTASSLEEIEGIGPTRRRHLLETFGGLQGVRNAGVEELARVKGINQALAERIYHALR